MRSLQIEEFLKLMECEGRAKFQKGSLQIKELPKFMDLKDVSESESDPFKLKDF